MTFQRRNLYPTHTSLAVVNLPSTSASIAVHLTGNKFLKRKPLFIEKRNMNGYFVPGIITVQSIDTLQSIVFLGVCMVFPHVNLSNQATTLLLMLNARFRLEIVCFSTRNCINVWSPTFSLEIQ